MPKYRQLHLKIIDSFDFNEMPDDFTRVVWLLLALILDSEGRGINNMAWVKSRMFPLRSDVTVEQLLNSFNWLEARKMIVGYRVNDRDYFYVPTFKNYQTGTEKEAKSSIPAPELLQSNYEVTTELLNQPELHCIESALNIVSESELNCIEGDVENREVLNEPLQANISITPTQAWDQLLGALRVDMPNQSFDERVSTTQLLDYRNGLFTIGVPGDYQREWLKGRLTSKVRRLMSGICNRAVDVEFVRIADE